MTTDTATNGLTIRPLQPATTSLTEIAACVSEQGVVLAADAAIDTQVEVTGITIDSRDVRTGDLYVGIPGARTHGAAFAGDAVQRGAVAMLTDAQGAEMAQSAGVTLPIFVSKRHPRELLGALSARIYRTETQSARTLGITGTNGKTSVVYLLAQLVHAAGLMPGLSSTAERRVGDQVMMATLTSPEAAELHGLLARMAEVGVDVVALEVSAQAIVRHRLDGVHFDVVAFNNFSQDHLDEFGDMEAYFDAKRGLFTPERAARGVVVVDSPFGQRIARETAIPVTTLATEFGQDADWHLAVTSHTLDGVSFVLQGPGGAYFRGRVPVFGRFMAENAALALVMLHEAGVPLARIASGLEDGMIPVYIPGRLEEITDGTGPRATARSPRFFVDYGHTPGSFRAMLDALGDVAPGRIIFMFGADGDRDPSKRAEMGRIAGAFADVVVVCDYNPRTEDPAAIREQLLAGVREGGRAEVHEEPSPHAAIRHAISCAEPGDVILYAGPGHEDFQEIAGQRVPFSARDEVRGALREAGLLA